MSSSNSDHDATWTTFGSVAAAAGAAVCCVGPVVAVSLGATGAWVGQMSALEPYRPLFMAVAAGCLGWGFYRVYGASAHDDAECAEGCEVPQASKMNRLALWGATAVVAILFASPYLLEWGATNARAQAEPPNQAEATTASAESEASSATKERVEMTVDGMTCQGCVSSVSSTLGDMEGVESVNVTLEPPRATVDFRSETVSADELVEAVDGIGYSAELQN